MKRLLSIPLFILAFCLLWASEIHGVGLIKLRWIRPPKLFPDPLRLTEVYGTSSHPAGPTTLHWILYKHEDLVPRPVGIVIHGGGFKAGDPGPLGVCSEVYYEGYHCVAIEYRLVEPAGHMRGENGDQPAGDHGLYPEQVDDVSMAIIAARTGSTAGLAGIVTGKVFAIGGSAGGTHALHMAGGILHGGDKLDCAVSLSGPTDFHDPSSQISACDVPFGNLVHNYVGCDAGDPGCDEDGGLLDLASPYRRFGPTSAPVMFFATSNDTVPPIQYTILRNKIISVGGTFESRLLTEASYTHSPPCTRHSFAYWRPVVPTWPDSVQDEALAFIRGIVPPP